MMNYKKAMRGSGGGAAGGGYAGGGTNAGGRRGSGAPGGTHALATTSDGGSTLGGIQTTPLQLDAK